MKLQLVVSFTFLLTISGVLCLKLINLSIPPVANFNEEAVLECDYDLAGQKLYSVKWYKDDYEFFRYMPDNSPSIRAIPVPGVNVDKEWHNYKRIVLRDLNFNSSGIYKCEISTEGPKFATVVESGFMTVMALPRDDPMIEGILTSYLMGDYVSGNCISQKSSPPPILSWYINNVKADPLYLVHPATDEIDSQGLHTRTLGIKFKVQRTHFQGAEKTLQLRCTANVEKMSWHRMVTTTLGPVISKKLAPERLSNKASRTSSIWIIGNTLILAAVLVLPIS